MSDDTWPERTLYSLAKYVNGRPFRPAETQGDVGLPVIRIAELNNGVTSRTGCYEGPVDDKHRVISGDLLFAWSGSIGIYRYQGPGGVLNQHIFRCTAAPGVDQDYLRYVLEAQLVAFNSIVEDMRTTMGHVKVADLKRMTVLLPQLEEQRRIAALLLSVDTVIEANRRVIETIGETVLAECHAAFEAQETEGDMSLVEAVRLVNGGAFTKGADQTGRMVVRIKELNSGPSATTVYSSAEVPEDKTVQPGDVLFAWSGSLGVWRWYRDEAIVNQHIFKVLPKAHPVWLGWVHILDALEEFRDIAAGKATTMGHVTKDHLQRARVPVLSSDEVYRLGQRVEPLWRHQLLVGREVELLQDLRAFLLPRLLSGELRVKAVAEPLEEAS